MLVPHRRDDAELGKGRRPADQRDKARIFVRLKPMRDSERFVDLRFDFAQRTSAFSLGETLGPLALSRDDLKSAGSDRIAKREMQKSESGQALAQRRL